MKLLRVQVSCFIPAESHSWPSLIFDYKLIFEISQYNISHIYQSEKNLGSKLKTLFSRKDIHFLLLWDKFSPFWGLWLNPRVSSSVFHFSPKSWAPWAFRWRHDNSSCSPSTPELQGCSLLYFCKSSPPHPLCRLSSLLVSSKMQRKLCFKLILNVS